MFKGQQQQRSLKKFNTENDSKPVELNYTNENITQVLTNLNDGKFDFKIFDAPTVNTIIKNQKLDNLKTIELKSDEQPFIYFILGQDQKDLQTFVNKRLKTLQKMALCQN